MDLEGEEKVQEFLIASRNWYKSSYLEEVTFNKSLMLLFVILISFSVILYDIWAKKVDDVVFYFPIFSEGDADDLYNVKSLDTYKTSLEEEVASYMLTKYITLRESYSPQFLEVKEWENLLQKIASLSSYKIFEEFVAEVLPNKNNDSPIIKYRLKKIVKPQIESLTFTKFVSKKPFTAEILFRLNICDLSQINCVKEKWLTQVNFDMAIIDELQSFDQTFPFKIISYQKEKISG